ncbi:proheadase_HK97, phage prohead protease, HK97 family [uncultured Caudovirales phage]|uniref:Proheadase_HK97, phage prohead protease, HK97 family n=3 Tax=uncultured Caudovirales phage TaxID=2100421 RepID=A0A6J5TCC8_9CAUD|nr:proheadase_HK97, phage prohead protease, HK97 family [uncultured Caudovirales phage]
MTKDVKFYYESKVALGVDTDEAAGMGTIEATFTTWGAREGADGRRFNYQPQPFQEWASAMLESGKPLPMYFQHNDEAMPVGEWTSFEFDDSGMNGTGRLFTNTSAGRDLYTIMKESPNLVGGVSVGAYADEWQMVDAEGIPLNSGSPTEEGFFQITKGGLREVSIVMQPNNLEANINKLESCLNQDGSIEPRNLESALRDAGVSKQNAAVAVSVFKEVLERRDAESKSLEKEPNRSDSETVTAEALLAKLNERELLKKLSNRLKG